MTKKRLWHYTGATKSHLGSILSTGVIRTTDANVSMTERVAPDVVWALDRPVVEGESHGLLYNEVHKGFGPTGAAHTLGNMKQTGVVVFGVPEAEAFHWLDWAPEQPGFDQTWVDIMIKTGGGRAMAESWWVVPRPVLLKEWIQVEDRLQGRSWVVHPLLGDLVEAV